MKVSFPRVSAEGGPMDPSLASQQARLVFQEGAGTLSDSYDRDKAAFLAKMLRVEFLRKIVLYLFYR